MYRGHFDRPGQLHEPGSISNLKECLHHTQADFYCKNVFANEALMKVVTESNLLALMLEQTRWLTKYKHLRWRDFSYPIVLLASTTFMPPRMLVSLKRSSRSWLTIFSHLLIFCLGYGTVLQVGEPALDNDCAFWLGIILDGPEDDDQFLTFRRGLFVDTVICRLSRLVRNLSREK